MSAIVSLGSVATFRKGSGLPKSALRPDGRFRCIHYGELFTKYGPVIVSPKSRTSADLPIRSTTGDVLMPTSDVTPRGLAKASAILQDGVVLGGDILVIRSNPARVDPRYLAYVIRNDANQVLKLVRGSTVYHLYATDMRQFQLSLPAIEQQKRAADALQDVDDLIATLERLIAKKQAIKQGMMQQLLTGRTRLPGFTGSWSMRKIGDFAEVRAGGTPSTSVSEFWGGEIPWMSSGEIHKKRVFDVNGRITTMGLQKSSAHLFPRRTVLMALAGQGKTRGTVAISHIDLTTNQSIAGIYPSSEHDPDYLYYSLDTRYSELRGESTGDGGRGGLNLTIIKNVEVPFPKVSEQRAIAAVLADVDNEVSALSARLTKARAIKTGMMQQLLTGRTRLPVEAAS